MTQPTNLIWGVCRGGPMDGKVVASMDGAPWHAETGTEGNLVQYAFHAGKARKAPNDHGDEVELTGTWQAARLRADGTRGADLK